MSEIEGSRLWGNAQNDAREDPSRGVAQAEVGHERDEPRLRVQGTEWIKAHAEQRSGDVAFAWTTPFPNP